MERDGLSNMIVPGTDPDVIETYASLSEHAVEAVFGFEDEIVFVDIETTGFEPSRDSIIEIAAIVARGPEVLERFHTMVDPGAPIPIEIVKLTGIDDESVAGAPGPEAAATMFAEFAGGRDIVAHNVSFDRSFLTLAAGDGRFRGQWLDSLQLAVISLPRLRSHRLYDLALAFGAHKPTHRATDDVDALAFLWRVMLCALDAMPPGVLLRLARLAPETAWPLRGLIAHMAGSGPAGAFDLKESRRHRVAADKAESMHDAEDVECHCPEVADIIDEFEAAGIAGRMYDGFERREEQARMAVAVLESFGSGSHMAIEAGTGVGKSIAYLVPAAKFAQANRVSIGVATKTNSLMDQLIYAELPALCRVLGSELRYVSLKGYEHYPCLRKLDRFAGDLDETDEQTLVAMAALITWVALSSWGDLDATNIHWRREIKAQISAAVADCTHKRCRYYPHLCYLHGVRRKAASAHVVVTNHALLFRDVVAAGGILPPIRHWVVDEAHAVESEARKQLTLEAGHSELSTVLSALHAKGRGGLFDTVRRKLRGGGGEAHGEIIAALARAEEAVTTATILVDSLFDFVKDIGDVVPSTGYDSTDVRLNARIRDTGPWGTVASVGSSLAKKLDAVLERGRALVTLLEEAGAEFADARADLAGLLTRVADQQAGLITVIDGEAREYVYWLSLDRRRNVTTEKLVAARLDVGEVLAEEFLSRSHSVVFTSATVATGDDFSHFAHGVGLDRLEEGAFRTLRLESSYDFENQMAVFVPTDMPAPNDPQYLKQLESLLEQVHLAMGGSTLTLFTNRRDMDALYRSLEPRLDAAGVSLLVQGRGVSAKRLRDEFIADTALSLFATKSFWEGFDAKGDTLRCVVVPRLPFGRPNDPLAEEREEREGRAAWGRYALPEAIIELKQAAGRLIRSGTDTGCLVIADVRVLQKGYGRDFLASLPVRDIERLPMARIAEEMERRFKA